MAEITTDDSLDLVIGDTDPQHTNPAPAFAANMVKLGEANDDRIADLGQKQPSDPDLTTIAGLTPADDDIMQRKSGAWTNRTVAQFKTDLALDADYDPAGAGAALAIVFGV